MDDMAMKEDEDEGRYLYVQGGRRKTKDETLFVRAHQLTSPADQLDCGVSITAARAMQNRVIRGGPQSLGSCDA